jgi:lysophospholipase L1-like esterase
VKNWICMLFLLASIGAAPLTINTNLHPRVLSGCEIQIQNDQVTLLPGIVRVGEKAAKVDKPATFKVAAAPSILVQNEEYKLTTEAPERWAKGTHLKGCIGMGVAAPGCLVANSVVVRLPDGSLAEEKKDYQLDTEWGALSRLEGGRIAADTTVKITYRVGQNRLDSLIVTADGTVALRAGKEEKLCPHPPDVSANELVVANVFVPVNFKSLAPWQVFVIGDSYAEPDEQATVFRTTLVSKTLDKLRQGRPVKIVAWGDSVTAGGDASTKANAFPELFTSRMQERFKKSKITLINAGVGATHTAMRLPGIQKEVLDQSPDLVLIEFVNDMGLSEATLRSNLDSAFAQIRAMGAEIILITPHFTMPSLMNLDFPRGKDSRPNVKVLREFAEDKAVALADVSRRWEHLELEGIPYTTYLRNGINHPDDRGHELFVKELLTFFPAE